MRISAPRLATLVAIALVSAPALVSAQAPSVDALRARAERLSAERPASVPEGTITSIEYLLDIAERIERRFPEHSLAWRGRAARFLESAEQGRDPYPEGKGQILNRGYDASFSPARQGYAIYIPPDYDPSRPWPMLVMLHGGSSNGNLFLGVVLGNNMDWETYDLHLYDDYTARWSPNMIVVAPDGVGQPIWRWMGEQDVLEVIEDVKRHYNVDPDRVALGGLSNGGMGAYSIGARHAWRFSHVQAMAGAPSWVQYTGGRPTEAEMIELQRVSALNLIENTTNTDFRFYHGTEDGGPMRPRYIHELTAHMEELGLDPQERWYQHGHDLLYIVHRHGRIYPEIAALERNRSPDDVVVVTGDYRANRQHWVTVTRIEQYPKLARVTAHAEDGLIRAETENVIELGFDLRDAPVGDGEVRVEIDGAEVYEGPRAPLGHIAHFARVEGAWRIGFLPPVDGLEKVPRLSGPMSDAYHDEIVHVYGTQDPDAVDTLRNTAQRGARGWPTGVWYLGQRVIPDTEVTEEMMRSVHLALYGAPGQNAVLDRIASDLPIRVEDEAVVLSSGERYQGRDVGARFVYPNPLAPSRYVLVHTGVSADAVSRTRNLPDFLPDYVVYDRNTVSSRPRLISGRRRQLAAGYFDRFWRLPAPPEPEPEGSGAGPEAASAAPARELPPGMSAEEMRELAILVGAPPDFIFPPAVLAQTPPPELEPASPPSSPPRPRRFLAPREDPNGPIARQIARMVPGFYNYRAAIAGGTWDVSRRARWRIRPEADCLAALDETGVPYERLVEPLETPTPTPVRIVGPVEEVAFVPWREDDTVVVSCELASRLPLLARIARREGTHRVVILSSHRTHPRISFHRLGMALDIFAFDTARGRLSVNDHFVETPSARTCEADPPDDWRAAALLRIACRLAESRRFSSVLTPNYNDGHRNHFHLDIRPDDDRVFVR